MFTKLDVTTDLILVPHRLDLSRHLQNVSVLRVLFKDNQNGHKYRKALNLQYRGLTNAGIDATYAYTYINLISFSPSVSD